MSLILNMILHLSQCLSEVDLEAIKATLKDVSFHDGLSTAGRAAIQVKQNLQADMAEISGILKLVEQRLLANDLFVQSTYPQQFVRLLISRYQSGMRYGTHVDEALINNQRTDISFTLFLSDQTQFQGGELVLEDSSGERSWKLDAGDLLIYPSTYLHRVNEVTEGERLVIVGWVTSRIRDPNRREILFDMEQSLREEFNQNGKTEQYDRLSRVRNNLLRQWLDR
ncbi:MULTISPECIES: Fe2+-dependent dioxygenase [unclassified Methylophaga]|uniref:Fe2+-dependent dioxygenase n=2 Tax=Methylophaga TaxID=40222 RepID=UPI0025E157AE|nr:MULTISPECIES: Fe2+-dependent dioxygenase [unclassified Methylophaga]|tara:strand:+ start:21049 stop:21723 length:675 start_codon:yes stop_codon:yes gene_type:complete